MANQIVVCTYRVRPEAEDEFVKLLLEERDGRPRWEFPHYERIRPGT